MPNPPRRSHDRPGESGADGTPTPVEGLGAEAAAAAEAAAEEEAAVWVEASGRVDQGEPSGWFRDDALAEVPEAGAGATPIGVGEPAALDEPDAGEDANTAAAQDDVADEDADAEADADAVPPAGTIYRTVPPLPEDAASRPRRRSRAVSVLLGLLILVVVAAGGFGVGMLLPLLIPLPAGDATLASPASTGGVPSAIPGASPAASPGATATAPPPPSVVASPAATPHIYVVKRGDQLGRIATSFGVTLQAIEAANGITNPNLIIPGQKLVIPAPDASPLASSSPSPGAAP